jgi:threonine synthase
MEIRCTVCSRQVPLGTMGRCSQCGGILKPFYHHDSVRKLHLISPSPGIDRFRPLLPVTMPIPYLGEGNTPLIPSRRIGPLLGLENLHFKHEGCNPSGAFKDRGAALAAALALEAGADGLLTASSGNAAAALSAHGAASGLKCLILLEPGGPPTKLRQSLATGARVLPVQGVFSHGPEAIGNLILQVAALLNYYPAFVWAPVNPYILEGIKTISYEITEQLSGAPDVIVCPVGGGDLLASQWRGYLELKEAGLIKNMPRMIGVQSLNAPPLLEAFRSGARSVKTLPYARSRISGINVPFTGDHALGAVLDSLGAVVGVDDDEVFHMQRRMAEQEGIWIEPVSAAPVAALVRLAAEKLIDPGERIVCILSGAGFKDSHLAKDEAEAVGGMPTLPFDGETIAKAAGPREEP